jgi:hypothetical protein
MINFPWSEPFEPKWDIRFEELKYYMQSHDGFLMVDRALYLWMRKQIIARDFGQLREEQWNKLNSIGLWKALGETPKTIIESPKAMRIDLLLSDEVM